MPKYLLITIFSIKYSQTRGYGNSTDEAIFGALDK